LEVGSRESGDKKKQIEDRREKREGGSWKPGDRKKQIEDRREKTEDGSRETDDTVISKYFIP
jgi:hypothetical protein